MKRRKVLGAELLTLVLAIALLTAAFPWGAFSVAAQEAKTWYVDDDLVDYPSADFTKIQDAVDAASSGDTITVYPGTYTENIDVNKDHLTIQSENGADSTIVQAANPDDHVFYVTADYVNMSGFTVKGAGYQKAGICLGGSDSDYVEYCNIFDNNVLNNNTGIFLYKSSGNRVTNNTVKSNNWGGDHPHSIFK